MDVAAAFLIRSRHYLGVEYPTKLARCLDALPARALWARSDEQSNSVGNLLVHLEGNVRQWLVSGVGGAPDHRRRSEEFARREGESAGELLARLRAALDAADAVLASLSAERLGQRLTVQGRDVSVFDAVYHVVEHFALHTGQVILLTKAAAPGRIRFYEDAGGLAIPLWSTGESTPAE